MVSFFGSRIPREPELIELFEKLFGFGPLPSTKVSSIADLANCIAMIIIHRVVILE